jgi:UPF0716 protein FxsA
MRFLIGLILLAFPFAEIFLLVELAHRYGWWLLVYLVAVGLLGLQLIRGEKLLMSAKMMQSMSAAGGNPIKAMLGSARNMVAGVLLIIPGVITDIIAVILLLIPISKPNPNTATNAQYQKAANDDVIEGEYTHVNEEKDKN